jgi:hypothetical protein
MGSCSLNFNELKQGTLAKYKQRSLYCHKAKVKAAWRDKQQDPETGSPLKCFGYFSFSSSFIPSPSKVHWSPEYAFKASASWFCHFC